MPQKERSNLEHVHTGKFYIFVFYLIMRPVLQFLIVITATSFLLAGGCHVIAQTPTPSKNDIHYSSFSVFGKNGKYAQEIAVLIENSRQLLRKGRIDSAMVLAFEARSKSLRLPAFINLYYTASCNQLLGEIYYTRYMESEAIEMNLLALDQFIESRDTTKVAEVLNSITNIGLSLENSTTSIVSLSLLTNITEGSKDPYLKALTYEAKADYFDASGEYSKATELFHEAGIHYQLAGKYEKTSDAILSQAISEFSAGKTNYALELVDSVKSLNLKNNLRKNYLEAVYYQAEFIGSTQPQEGIKIIENTLGELRQSKLNIHLGIFLKLLVSLQKQTGDFQNAFKNNEEFHKTLNEIYSSEAERKIADLQLQLEKGSLNHRINMLQKERELALVNSRSQRNMLFYFFLATIVLFTMALNNMRRLQYRLYLLKEFTLDFPIGRYLLAFGISLAYYTGILYLVNPLNLSADSVTQQLLHYAITGFLISALTTTGIILLPSQWSAKPGFNRRFTATALIFIAVINVVVILYAAISDTANYSWIDNLNIILVVTGITMMPLFFFIIYLEKVLLRKHIHLAGLLSNRIHTLQPEKQSDLVEIYSDRSKDVIKLDASNLLLIEAAGNYAKIVFAEENKIKTTLILATMKLLESQLANYQQFSRCHKSYIVNLKKVKKVLGNSHGYKLEIPGIDDLVPVSRSYAETFIKSIDKVYREN